MDGGGDTAEACQKWLVSQGENPGAIDGKFGDTTARAMQSYLKNHNIYHGKIDGHFRDGNGESMRAFQKWLVSQGFEVKHIDGRWGTMTVRAFQRFLNDSDLSKVSNLESPLKVDGHMAWGGDTAEACQKWLVSQGYNPGPIDGKFGDTTARAIQSYLKNRNLYHGNIDGHFRDGNGESMREFQKWLVSQGFGVNHIDGRWGYMTVCTFQRFLNDNL